MANVTYLLGAGASGNCLPTYINFKERFQYFVDRFSTNYSPLYNNLKSEKRKDAENIHLLLTEINKDLKAHSTPDTLAKKYFHSNTNNENLQNLKLSLILFFIYEQYFDNIKKDNQGNIFKDRNDKRYDSLIAAILRPIEGKKKLLDNFKVMTWNYDLQLEIAFAQYVNPPYINFCQEALQSFPRVEKTTDKFDPKQFGIVHLNGIAYATPEFKSRPDNFIGIFIESETELLEYIVDIFHTLKTFPRRENIGGESLLAFAWENLDENFNIVENESLKIAIQIAEETEILVIVGYSFPIFNNPIDSTLLSKMKDIKKVYIQSPDGENIKRILLNELTQISQNDIQNVGYWNQFHIPSEWNKKISPAFPIAVA